LRFIHVGVGGFGSRWAERLAGEREAEVVALVDTSPKALAACREQHGYAEDICFASLQQALDSVRADALVCVVPPAHHRGVACAAMEAGLAVLTEKPMAGSIEDCRAMLECAERTGRICAVSQNYRYEPATWTMAELVRRGEIGAVGQLRVEFFCGHDFGGGFRHRMDYPLLVDMSIHHFDLIRFITGLNALSARGESWNPPWSNYRGDASCSVLFEMSGGARALYSGSWCSKGQFGSWIGNWQVEGELGTITCRDDRIRIHRAPELYEVREVVDVEMTAPHRDGMVFSLQGFMRAVRSGERPPTDLADNVNSVGMVFAAVDAVRTGRRCPVPGREPAAGARQGGP
jgi:predicted dehydrogenase